VYKVSVRVAQKTHIVSVVKIKQVMLYDEIVVFVENTYVL